MGGLYGKSMTSPRRIPGSPSRLRAQHRKLTAMRYYGNVMTTTIWRLRILHLQQYSRRLNLFVRFFFPAGIRNPDRPNRSLVSVPTTLYLWCRNFISSRFCIRANLRYIKKMQWLVSYRIIDPSVCGSLLGTGNRVRAHLQVYTASCPRGLEKLNNTTARTANFASSFNFSFHVK